MYVFLSVFLYVKKFFLLVLVWYLVVSGKVVAKFCAKYLHTQVLKNEASSTGDLGTSVQRAFLR